MKLKTIYVWLKYIESLEKHGITLEALADDARLKVVIYASWENMNKDDELAIIQQDSITCLDPEIWDFDKLGDVGENIFIKKPKQGECTIHPTGEKVHRLYCEAVDLLNRWSVDDSLRSYPSSKYDWLYR